MALLHLARSYQPIVDEYDHTMVYTKDQVWVWTNEHLYPGYDGNGSWLERSFLQQFAKFASAWLNPTIYSRVTPAHLQQHDGANSDVWTSECAHLVADIKLWLDGQRTNDRSIPRYQMIIESQHVYKYAQVGRKDRVGSIRV